MVFTIIILIVTVLISLAAFENQALKIKLMLWPRQMHEPKEYYRLLTHGFIHNDWNHLIANMFTLFFFGRNMEYIITSHEWLGRPGMLYITLYLTGIIIASLPSFIRNRNNSYYASLGASGGVSAVLFATIYYSPWSMINFIIPGIIYAILYVAYSSYMDKKGSDNVGHNAHLWGAIYGFLFAFGIDPSHGYLFWFQITHPHFG